MTQNSNTDSRPPDDSPDIEEVREVAEQARSIEDSKAIARMSALSSGADTLQSAVIMFTLAFVGAALAKMVFAVVSGGSITDPFYSPALAVTTVAIGIGMACISVAYFLVGIMGYSLRRTHGSMFNDYDEDLDGPLSGRELTFHLAQSIIMGMAGLSILGLGILYTMTVTSL